jgi:hypothetical protein
MLLLIVSTVLITIAILKATRTTSVPNHNIFF